MDLCIRVDFLTGRYIATDANARDKHEWPAHPNRLFSASVAALHDGDVVNEDERAALQWLETLGAPALVASEADSRSVAAHYVPVNDASIVSLGKYPGLYEELARLEAEIDLAPTPAKRASIEKKIAKKRDVTSLLAWNGKGNKADLLPDQRNKQPRFYPSVTPAEPTQWFIWSGVDDAALAHHRLSLANVLGRITRLGHSSSFVCVSLADEAPAPNWLPDPQGPHRLRVVIPGQLQLLEENFAQRATHVTQDAQQAKTFSDIAPRTMPSLLASYRKGVDAVEEVDWSQETGQWMAFEYVQGRRFPITRTWEICRAFRSALLAHANDPTSPYLCGHEADGTPTKAPHIKVIAPGYVRGKYASGIGMGIVLILPDTKDEQARRNVLQAIGAWERADQEDRANGLVRLYTTGGGEAVFQRTVQPERKTMRAETWTRPAKVWETVTPIALDRNPKFFGHPDLEKHEKAVEQAVQAVWKACRDQGLEPEHVEVSRRPFFKESADAKAFGRVSLGGLQRFLIHARITFAHPVGGPVVLGAGRFFGMGLCIPGGQR